MAEMMRFVFPVVMIVLVVASYFYQQKMKAVQAATYAHFTLGDVARSLGLSVVEGDPSLNLMLVQSAHGEQKMAAHGGVLQKMRGDGAKETRARAAGQVWGRPFELLYAQRTELEHGFAEKTWTMYFDFSLACAVQVEVPQFEIVLRNPQRYLEPKIQTALPPQPTGNSGVDAIFVVKCADPRFAAAVVPALLPLMTQSFVHLVGGGRELRAVTTQMTHSVLLQGAREFERALEHLACVVEGRPVDHLAAA